MPEAGAEDTPDYAREWQTGRAARAAKPKSTTPRDPEAAARRAQQRADRVSAGLAELETWLRDQVRAGLSTAAASGYQHAEAIAARMVDAQAPGVAGTLRRLSPLPVSGDGWPGRLLAEYAQLHLLARAYGTVADLPAPLAATVRSRIGFTTGREEVLAGPAVTDHWLVLGGRDLLDAAVPARRIWLRGRASGRFALLLSFAVGGVFGGNPDANLVPGTELHADLHFYPGQPALRAVVGARHAEPVTAAQPEEADDVAGLLGRWASALGQDPWLTEWPALLAGVPVPDEGALAVRGRLGAGRAAAGLRATLAAAGGVGRLPGGAGGRVEPGRADPADRVARGPGGADMSEREGCGAAFRRPGSERGML